MFPAPGAKLADLLLSLLTKQPGLTAAEIRCAAVKERHCSQAAIYKELKKLIEQGILIKVDGRYRPSFTWITHILALAEELEQRFVHRSDWFVLPAPGEKVVFRFSNLYRLNDFSSHVILSLVSRAENKNVYSWNPHPWFYLIQGKQESDYINALRLAGGRFWKVIGGDSFLDQWTKQFWRDKTTEYAFAPHGFERQRNVYYNVVGEHIASFRLDAGSTARIEALYQEVKSRAQLEPGRVLALLHDRCRASFTVEHNPKRAAYYRRKFSRFFGFPAAET